MGDEDKELRSVSAPSPLLGTGSAQPGGAAYSLGSLTLSRGTAWTLHAFLCQGPRKQEEWTCPRPLPARPLVCPLACVVHAQEQSRGSGGPRVTRGPSCCTRLPRSVATWAQCCHMVRPIHCDCWMVFPAVDGLWLICSLLTGSFQSFMTGHSPSLGPRAASPSAQRALSFRESSCLSPDPPDEDSKLVSPGEQAPRAPLWPQALARYLAATQPFLIDRWLPGMVGLCPWASLGTWAQGQKSEL